MVNRPGEEGLGIKTRSLVPAILSFRPSKLKSMHQVHRDSDFGSFLIPGRHSKLQFTLSLGKMPNLPQPYFLGGLRDCRGLRTLLKMKPQLSIVVLEDL